MTRLSSIILAVFLLLGIFITLLLIYRRKQGGSLLGKPSIDSFYFYTGKLSIFFCLFLFIIKAFIPSLGYILVPLPVALVAVALLMAGSVMLIIAMTDLGSALKAGLPAEKTSLKQHGLYRFSRNPIYLSLYLMAIASCLYFPDLINITFAIYGIFIHHQIIKAEETFLERRFGKEWTSYSHKTKRYL